MTWSACLPVILSEIGQGIRQHIARKHSRELYDLKQQVRELESALTELASKVKTST